MDPLPLPSDPVQERPEPDAGGGDGEVELTLVTLSFESGPGDDGRAERLLAVLARYVVLSRQQPGCRNIDLCASQTEPGRFLVIEKWESPAAQRRHFDSPEMVEMALACRDLVSGRPAIDLLAGVSAHDLL